MTESPLTQNESRLLVALDQGTTSSRAIAYRLNGEEVFATTRLLPNYFPADGWVEQNPREIWETLRDCLFELLEHVGPQNILALGLTNQRETTICWSRSTGQALAPAIVWQCRRTAGLCKNLRDEGLAEHVRARTGLVIDSYFSASKILWLIENIPTVKKAVSENDAVFGTVDSWILFQLTGQEMSTDFTNASRTMLFDLEKKQWDALLLKRIGISEQHLCRVKPSDAFFGEFQLSGAKIPICAVLGDQHASLFGHACFAKHSCKCTFGTGAFLLLQNGSRREHSSAGMLETTSWNISREGALAAGPQYALEGSVFVAGSLITWLKDKVGLLESAAESENLARSVMNSGGVNVIPAFVGLGAPHWREDVRGAILGITRDTSRAHIIRASLEGIAHLVADLLDVGDFNEVTSLDVDGGMTRNNLFCQLLADYTNRNILVKQTPEMTAKGVAALAGYSVGVFDSILSVKDFLLGGLAEAKCFTPHLTPAERQVERSRFHSALSTLLK